MSYSVIIVEKSTMEELTPKMNRKSDPLCEDLFQIVDIIKIVSLVRAIINLFNINIK